jgi:anti-sigma factor RsiW
MTERQIGGLWCHEVLEQLDRYVDGTLDTAALEAVQEHTAECDNCARFGGAYAALVHRLRAEDTEALGEARARRLATRLAREAG